MFRRWLTVLAIIALISSGTGIGLSPSTGDHVSDRGDLVGDRGDQFHRSADCPAADPALAAQYRAALQYLRSEGARRVVVLRRLRCPDADLELALRETKMKRLGKPVVVRERRDWARLDGWGEDAGGDVTLLSQDGELLAEAISQKQAARWRSSFWYAPGMEQERVLEKLGFAHKFKIVTTSHKNDSLTGPKEDVMSTASEELPEPAAAYPTLKTGGNGSTNTSHTRKPLDRTANSRSIAVLRWAPPLPPSRSPGLQVLRASPWLLSGVHQPGQVSVEQPATLLVQQSLLRAQLAAAGCGTWRAEVSGVDPLNSVPLRRSYTQDSMPVAVALQGEGPLRLTVRCPSRGATLRCRVDPEQERCQWSGEGAGRRRRAADPSYGPRQSAGWRRPARPSWRRAGPGSQYQHRTGESGRHPVPAGASRQVTSDRRPTPYRSEGAVQRRSGEPDQHQTPAGRQSAPHRRHWRRTPSSIHRSGQAPHGDYHGATYQRDSGATYPTEYSDANYPTEYSGAAYRRRSLLPRRRQDISDDIKLAVLPHFSSCGGALGGCFLCIAVLETLNTTISSVACVGPCAVGGSTACSGALGNLYKQVVEARRAKARLDRFRR